jgi:hypothetical protein
MGKSPAKTAVWLLLAGGVVALTVATALRQCNKPPTPVSDQEKNPEATTSASPPRSAETTPAPLPSRPPALAIAAGLDEAQLMAKLRSLKEDNPAAVIELAREGNKRFPDSTDAPERTSILIHALVITGASSEARGEAENMVNHYPDSEWVREIERFTGAHRHRNIRVNSAGQIEYY